MICANATGSHKIPLYVIGKFKKPRCMKNVSDLPVVYTAQAKGWMNQRLFIEWYKTVFLPSIKSKGKEGDKYLLLLDRAPSHPDEDLLNQIDPCCTVKYLPANTTAKIQPMDQCVISSLKNHYKTSFARNL